MNENTGVLNVVLNGLVLVWLIGFALAVMVWQGQAYLNTTHRLALFPPHWATKCLKAVLRYAIRAIGRGLLAAAQWFLRKIFSW